MTSAHMIDAATDITERFIGADGASAEPGVGE